DLLCCSPVRRHGLAVAGIRGQPPRVSADAGRAGSHAAVAQGSLLRLAFAADQAGAHRVRGERGGRSLARSVVGWMGGCRHGCWRDVLCPPLSSMRRTDAFCLKEFPGSEKGQAGGGPTLLA